MLYFQIDLIKIKKTKQFYESRKERLIKSAAEKIGYAVPKEKYSAYQD